MDATVVAAGMTVWIRTLATASTTTPVTGLTVRSGGGPMGGAPEAQVGTGTTWRTDAATTSDGRTGRRSATSAVTKVTDHQAIAVADVVTTIHVSTSTARRLARAVMAGQ